MQHLSALEKLTCVLENAKCAVQEKRPEAARDRYPTNKYSSGHYLFELIDYVTLYFYSCMQGFALLDLICTTNLGFVTQFQTCKTLLDDIIKNLPSPTKEHENAAVHSLERNTVLDEEATTQQEEGDMSGGDNDEEIRHTTQFGFRAVIGCEVAKSSLLENVVLPMTLASTTFSHVFQGLLL